MILVSVAPHAAAAAVCGAVALLTWWKGRPGAAARLLAACAAAMAIGGAANALDPVVAPLQDRTVPIELARIGFSVALLLHLAGRTGAGEARAAHLVGVMAAVLGAVALLPVASGLVGVPATPALLFAGLGARLPLALLVLLLAENAYRNAGEAERWHVNLPCIALGGLALFDAVIAADAVLSRGFSPALLDARAVLSAFAAPLLLVAALRDRRWHPRVRMPRQAVFHGATLLLGGAFLAGLGSVGEAVREAGGNWGLVAEASLLSGGALALAVALSARSVRSRLRRHLVDPFFRARFDYRREWMRCVAVLSAPDSEAPAEVRAIRALADAVDSPAGVLLLRDPGEDGLRWGGSWNAPAVAAPSAWPLDHALAPDRVLAFAPDAPAPAALTATYGPIWLAVPLLHHRDGVLGAVLLSPPRAAFPLDEEVFDLLRTLGREVALLLAERRAAARLADGRRRSDYAARFAFVAHDVKTVSGGLKLLLGNAEAHIADPEFQRDMLLTVRAATARIDGLIARLREPAEAAPPPAPLRHSADLPERLRRIAAARRADVVIEGNPPTAPLAIEAEALDTAIGHLLDNAVEASVPRVPVTLRLHRAEGREVLDITDRGPGMTEAFIRNELFRPLRTGRPDGNGIGAWQARELMREAGGALEVLSRPGIGTTMRLVLPLRDEPATVPETVAA